jgi:prepilin-type N-terminal cleavage/methylation domain-containing protein
VRQAAGRARPGAPAGFTLLEIAIALAILGVGVVSVMQIFGASLRLQDRASRESRAVLHARAAMDALLFQPEIVDHTEERDTAEGFHTKVLVRHAGVEEGLDEKELEFQSEVSLRYLQVDVTWQDGIGKKTYTLKSLRMAPEVE